MSFQRTWEAEMLADVTGTGRRVFGFIALSFGIMLWVGATPPSAQAGNIAFPQPPVIEPNVEFWVKVFSQYTSRDFIVHDRDDVSRVYQVMHLPGDGNPNRDDIDWTNTYLKAKYTSILNRLASGTTPSSFEERQVAALFHNASPSTYAHAAQNLRVQQGLREQFREGLLRSRYYRPTMERIFREAGIPVELVTLAEVESGFYPGARSSAGATGIWQFTRSTGQQYMRITPRFDERLDPVRETEAAAKLLRDNYEALGDWPLAITAYNYGTGGMMQAAEIYNSNYSEVFKNFDGSHFGFAAKNYYSEFLAALHIHGHENQYFPGIEYDSVGPPRQPSPVLRNVRRVSHRHYAHASQLRSVVWHRGRYRHGTHVCTGRCTVTKHSKRLAES
jgi:membrane-bound lytic murein transglycosylase D